MIRLRPRTLLWRIGLALISAQLIIAIFLGGYTFFHLRRFHYDQTLAELQRVMPILVARLADGSDLSDEEHLDRLVKDDSARTGIRVTVILPGGQVIADSDAMPAEMENHRYGRKEIEEALTSGEGSAIRYSATLGESMMYFAQRVEAGGENGLIVRSALPLTTVNRELSRITRVVAGAGALSLLATLLVIYFVSRRFSGQVSTLAAGAARFARGELDHRVAPPAATELSALAESLNDMAQQLDDRIRQLQTQRNEQRAILQSMSNGVIAVDAEHRIIILNRAAEALLGHSADDTQGRLLEEVVREAALHGFVADALAGRSVGPSDLLIGPDGAITVEATGETLLSADGEPKGLLIILNEVTQLRRLESLRSDFAANVSHELRTPITNIKGYVETLLDIGWTNHDQAERFLKIIGVNSSRLAAIVEDVMALSKLEQPLARESLEHDRITIASLLESMAMQFEQAARERGISLIVEAREDITVLARRQLIEQAVANLVSNAVRYADTNSRITLRAEATDEAVVIAVEDEGPGIAAEHLPRIFERFYRVDKGRSRKLGGTGLGLAIVKHVALIHGGRAEVESSAGRGSVFRIVLPRERAG